MYELIHLCASFISVSAPLPCLYTAFKRGDNKPINGPYIFSLLFYTTIWFIYGDSAKIQIYQNPLFLFLGLVYSIASIVLKGEYANLVYHHVIIINTSWYLRQEKAGEIYKYCVGASVFFIFSHPVYRLYHAMKNKDSTQLRTWEIATATAANLTYAIYFLLQETLSYLAFLHLSSLALALIELKVRSSLLELDRVNKKNDGDEVKKVLLSAK